jgi:hypothetical protein
MKLFFCVRYKSDASQLKYIDWGRFVQLNYFVELREIVSQQFNNLYPTHQGCQMVYFQTKNPSLGKFWRVLPWNELVYFRVFWDVLGSFGMFWGLLGCFGILMGTFSPFWYVLSRKIWQSCYALRVESTYDSIITVLRRVIEWKKLTALPITLAWFDASTFESPIRVARWYILKPKIPIWVNFWRSCNGFCWNILGHLIYFTAIWYIL